jgi:CRP-like cAMP-binding protein
MSAGPKPVDKSVLKNLVPPASLVGRHFQEIVNKAVMEEIAPGRLLFKRGDRDRKTIYLLSGQVDLVGENGKQGSIIGGSKEARHPVANQQPREVTAQVKSRATIVSFDNDLLDVLLTWDQLSGIEVSDISPGEEAEASEGGDWMTRILQSKAFLRIPPANIQTMFMRLTEFPVKAGQTIINQGDAGDFYYIIGRGTFTVSRESANGTSVVLAQLEDGDAFGEEALLSNAKRNATIIAKTDGLLMRLSKRDFEALLKEPTLKQVDVGTAKKMVGQGAVLLDVRMDSEHRANGIRGSMNVPLYMLRLKSESLDRNKRYICYCETGRRASAAAFLLSEKGFESYVLKGGLQGITHGTHGG